jgi:hypothetical protein
LLRGEVLSLQLAATNPIIAAPTIPAAIPTVFLRM